MDLLGHVFSHTLQPVHLWGEDKFLETKTSFARNLSAILIRCLFSGYSIVIVETKTDLKKYFNVDIKPPFKDEITL
jgi:hypothetical protein